MAVNFELYKVFMAVATNRSFSKASEELQVTQSAVSQSISKLENELGKQLFERSTTGLVLTDEGKLLLETVSVGYHVLASAENKIKNEVAEKQITSLKIACSPIIFKKIVSPVLFQCLNQNVNLDTNSLLSDKDKVFFVKEGLIDFCIIKDYGIPIDLDLYIKKIFTLNYVFFYNPQFFKINSIDEIKNYPLIIKAGDTKGRKEFDKLFANLANNCPRKIEVSHDDLIIGAVENGLGIGFAPKEYISAEMQVLTPNTLIQKDLLLVCKTMSPLIKNFIAAFSQK